METRLARELNPTNECVCQTCGQTLDIRTVYLTKNSTKKFNKLLPEDEHLSRHQSVTIFEAIDILVEEAGDSGYGVLEDCFDELTTVERDTERFKNKIGKMVDDGTISPKSHWLSPGKMGNPPDRIDGLHSYGSPCCRPFEDTGRDPDFLRGYGRDRRAYENWVDGRWSAADRLMTQTDVGICQDNNCDNNEKLDADHIGPLSLGFVHDPVNLRGLCPRCNSTRRNSLTCADVELLRRLESKENEIASRQVRSYWNRCKSQVESDADAEKLRKGLRDIQHQYLVSLHKVLQKGRYDLLVHLLNLDECSIKYTFQGVDSESLNYDEIVASERSEK